MAGRPPRVAAPLSAAEEAEALRQHQAANPGCLAFQDLTDLALSLDERLLELDLERRTRHVEGLLAARRAGLRGGVGLPLPLLAAPKPAAQWREERARCLERIAAPSHPEALRITADECGAAVAAAARPRNTPAFALETLRRHFEQRLQVLPRWRHRLLTRWMRYCRDTELICRCEGVLLAKIDQLDAEFEAAGERVKRLAAAAAAAAAAEGPAEPPARARLRPGQRPLDAAEVAASAVPQACRLPAPGRPPFEASDFQTYFQQALPDTRLRARLRRLLLRGKWLGLLHRRALHAAAAQALQAAEGPGARESTALPRAPGTEEETVTLLRPLVAAFGLGDGAKCTAPDLAYLVAQRFTAMFRAQAAAFDFQAYDAAKGSPGPAAPGGSNNGPRVGGRVAEAAPLCLKVATWVRSPGLRPRLSLAQRQQTAALAEVTPDRVLQAEAAFLGEQDFQWASRRLKELADSHTERAAATQPGAGERADSKVGAAPPARKDREARGPGATAAANPRRHALYCLRYLRLREFRRRLLTALNGFRAMQRRLWFDATGGIGGSRWADPDPAETNPGVGPSPGSPTAKGEAADVTVDDLPRPLGGPRGVAHHGAGARAVLAHHAAPNDYGFAAAAAGKGGGPAGLALPEDRDDAFVRRGSDVLVQDSSGVFIMYDAAVTDLEALEAELLRLASHYLDRPAPPDLRRADVDRWAVLEDVYECEALFQEGKRKVSDCLLEAYEHAVDPAEQAALAQSLEDLFAQRPRLDLTAAYFAPSYASEALGLELLFTLLREVLQAQVAEEDRLLAEQRPPAREEDRVPGARPLADPNDDPRLVMPLLPDSSPINVLRVLPSLGLLHAVVRSVDATTAAVCRQFRVDNPLAVSGVWRAVLLQTLVEWRLLGEEGQLRRQAQNYAGWNVDAPSALELPACVERLARDLAEAAEGGQPAPAPAAAAGAAVPLAAHTAPAGGGVGGGGAAAGAPAGSTGAPASDGGDVLSGALEQAYLDVLEAGTIRQQLGDCLAECEVLYNVHRRQGAQLGVAVGRFRLEPLDFERQRVACAVDEPMGDSARSDDPPVQTDFLHTLAIGELDAALEAPDLATVEGLGRRLAEGLGDLRWALRLQAAEAALLASAAHYNQLPLDAQLAEPHRLRVHAGDGDHTFLTTPAADAPEVRPRGSVASAAPAAPAAFLSVTRLKALHRQALLAAWARQSAEVLRAKRPDLLRRQLRELKGRLMDDYAQGLVAASQAYALRHQAAALAAGLATALSHWHVPPALATLGGPGDALRDAAASPAERGRGGAGLPAPPCCLVALDGRVEDALYVPHRTQFYGLAEPSVGGGLPEGAGGGVPAAALAPPMADGDIRTALRVLAAVWSIVAYAGVSAVFGQAEGEGLHAGRHGHPADFVLHVLRTLRQELNHLVDPGDPASVLGLLECRLQFLHDRLVLILGNVRRRLQADCLADLLAALDTTPELLTPDQFASETDVLSLTPAATPSGPAEEPDAALAPEPSPPLGHLQPAAIQLLRAAVGRAVCQEAGHIDSFLDTLPPGAAQEEGGGGPAAALRVRAAGVRVALRRERYRAAWAAALPHRDHRRGPEWEEEQFHRIVTAQAKALRTAEQDDDAAFEAGPMPGKASGLDLRLRQITVLRRELNKALLRRAIAEVQRAGDALEAGPPAGEAAADRQALDRKQHLFRDFVRQLLASATALRSEGSDAVLFQLSDAALLHAIDRLGLQLREWREEESRAARQTAELIADEYRATAFRFERQALHWQAVRDGDRRGLERRLQVRVVDEKYALIFQAEALGKRVEQLVGTIQDMESAIHRRLRAEYEGRLQEQQAEISLLQERFKDYKAKLFREMHVNLEEIKRNALLEIGKSDVAPLHMKRQALRMAITEDEINKLKDENEQLALALAKVKVLHDLKVLSLTARYEKRLEVAEAATAELSGRYWGNQQVQEEKEELLRQQLAQTQTALSQCEAEVEQLRRDLAGQLKAKKELLGWKLSQTRALEDLQRRLKRYEKWSQYDVERLVAEAERRKQEPQRPAAGDARPAPPESAAATATAKEKADARKDREIQQLKAQLVREQRLKQKAFQRLDQLQGPEAEVPAAEDVWQQRYFDAALQLQRTTQELDAYRRHVAAYQLPPPDATLAAGDSGGSPFVSPLSSGGLGGLPHLPDSSPPSSPPAGRPGSAGQHLRRVPVTHPARRRLTGQLAGRPRPPPPG